MPSTFTPYLWVTLSLPLLILLQRWIHRHLRGIALLITGSRSHSLMLYAFVLLPGVFLHELSHWLTAGLLGVRTGRFSLWPQEDASGVQLGYVEYYRDARLGFFRESLIGGAPLIYGVIAILLICFRIFDLPALTALIQVARLDYLVATWSQLLNTPDLFLWLYLLFAISNAMMPSPSDRRAWPGFFLFMLVAVVVFFLLDLTPILMSSLTEGWLAKVALALATAFTITIVLDVVAMLFLLVLELVLSRLRGQYVRYE